MTDSTAPELAELGLQDRAVHVDEQISRLDISVNEILAMDEFKDR